jgi:hypothetical protein
VSYKSRGHTAAAMWAGRADLVDLSAALAVPSDVRGKVLAPDVCPLETFSLYEVTRGSAGVAITGADDPPYELYLSYECARTSPGVLSQLARTRGDAHAALARLLPPSADRALPACRVVQDVETNRRKAMDVVFPPGDTRGARFPLTANVLTFSAADAARGDFARPLRVARRRLYSGVAAARRTATTV